MRISFFARVHDPAMLTRVQFYAQDLAILRGLGHQVDVATRAHQLRPADVYFIWWWTWAFQPLALAGLLRRPAIITGVFDEWAFDARPAPHRWLLRQALRRADANLFVSRLEREIVPARFTVQAPAYAPLTADLERHQPGTAPREPFLLTMGWLTAGNAERKGIPTVLRAVARLRARHPALRLVVAGTAGDGVPGLQALAAELGISDITDFPGPVSDSEKVSLMQRCAAYLQPSTFEGFGLAALEAMACGAPVVASTGGALPEVIGDGGFAVPDPTPATLAAAVDRILSDPALAADLSARGAARAREQFSPAVREHTIREILTRVGKA